MVRNSGLIRYKELLQQIKFIHSGGQVHQQKFTSGKSDLHCLAYPVSNVVPFCHTRFATHLSMCPYLLKDSEILFSTSVVQLHQEGAVAATKGWHLRQKEIEPVAMPQYRPV